MEKPIKNNMETEMETLGLLKGLYERYMVFPGKRGNRGTPIYPQPIGTPNTGPLFWKTPI